MVIGLSEYKHCSNAAADVNSKNARRRSQVLWGSMSTGAKEVESSTGHVWAAGFHPVMARSRLAHVLKLMNCLFIQFSNFFSGHG
jgi:hypothetical protein